MVVNLKDQNFDQEVMQSSLPVVIDFWAEWCGPCRQLMPVVHELADTYAGRIKVVAVNVDECPETAERFGIMTIPTLLFIKQGQIIDKHVGMAMKPTVAAKFESLL